MNRATVFGRNLFVVYFEFLFCPPLLTWIFYDVDWTWCTITLDHLWFSSMCAAAVKTPAEESGQAELDLPEPGSSYSWAQHDGDNNTSGTNRKYFVRNSSVEPGCYLFIFLEPERRPFLYTRRRINTLECSSNVCGLIIESASPCITELLLMMPARDEGVPGSLSLHRWTVRWGRSQAAQKSQGNVSTNSAQNLCSESNN